MKTGSQLRRTPLARGTSQMKRSGFQKRSPASKKPTSVSRRTKKPKAWTTDNADRRFSVWIRERDGNRCLRCKTEYGLTCSHFWRRGHSGTRFEPDNCITLCGECHAEWEHLKNTDYKVYMLEWLGRERYDEVETMARTFKKRSDAVAECRVLLSPPSTAEVRT